MLTCWLSDIRALKTHTRVRPPRTIGIYPSIATFKEGDESYERGCKLRHNEISFVDFVLLCLSYL